MVADCTWTRPRIIAYLDGGLDEPDEALVNEHLSGCPACRSVAAAERALTARVRAVAGSERAPAELAERVRRSLAEAEAQDRAAEAPAAPAPRKQPVPRRGVGWGLALASAAALLIIVAGAIFWPASGPSLVAAMADEHYQHSASGTTGTLELVSADPAEIESYLTGKLGVPVKLPKAAFPKSQGACCPKRGRCDLGLVACFCQRRNHPVTLFIVKSEGLSLSGLEEVQSGGRSFWRGSAGTCRALLWKNGDLCYALVGEFKDAADQLDLASRTAAAVEGLPQK